MKAFIRTDASNQIGSGHVMRCLTLARALRQEGADIQFICRPHPGNLIAWITDQGFPVLQLPEHPASNQLEGYARWLGCTEAEDAEASIKLLPATPEQLPLLIVDHYGLGATYTRQLQHRFQHRLMIDDLANRLHDCDTLLDQNLLEGYQQRYQDKVNPACTCLLGPEYALLAEAFHQWEPQPDRQRLLVFFGGSDPFHLTLLTVTVLQQMKHQAPPVDVVIGQEHPDQQTITAGLQQLPDARLHIQTRQMARLMSEARLMLGAGGTTHWERCSMALPGLIVTVAENQQATTAYLAQQGACHWLGDAADLTETRLHDALLTLLADAEQLARMSATARRLVPRDAGVPRVIRHLMRVLKTGKVPVGNNA